LPFFFGSHLNLGNDVTGNLLDGCYPNSDCGTYDTA